jgi:eukaryotic-like serine/threonine-protein kinase
MALERGAHLGDYEALEPLGAGGMGEVWLARDRHLHRKVALKVLPIALNSDEARVARFQQEARLASSLNHPNVCTIHALGELSDGRRFIAMEFIEGQTLRLQLARHKLTCREAINLAVQIASALTAAHAGGVVHRDIKPENVIVRPDGVVKVLDFGLAKLDPLGAARPAESTQTLVETQAGAVMGTVVYMSPEQARGQDVDARTDIWSLGVLLYEMVAGRVPFEGPSSTDILAAILDHEPDALARFEPHVPAELNRIVTKALRKDRAHRYQTMQDLLLDLEALADELRARHPSSDPLAVPAGAGKHARPGGRSRERDSEPSRSGTQSVWSRRTTAVVALLAIAVGAIGWLAIRDAGGLRHRWLGGERPQRVQSLAVLPLENLSRDPEQDYFADAMTDELITAIGHIGALKVISRTSVMHYKGSKKTIPDIARELRVDAVLQGSVVRSGDRIRITAQLTDGVSDHNLWGQSYERPVQNVLALQDEVARAIAGEIRVRLPAQPSQAVSATRTVNPTAHEAYLKGRYHLAKWTPEGYQRAGQFFQQAIAEDPAYAEAYAGLADSHALLGYYGVIAPKDAFPRAKAAALKALELNDTLSEAHTSMALITDNFEWQWTLGEQEFKRALALNPSSAMAHLWYSYHLAWTGNYQQAIEEARRAEDLDPLSLVASTSTANIFFDAKQFDRAIEQCRKVLDLDPSFRWAHHSLGEAYIEKGMFAEGVKELALGIDPDRRNPHFVAKLAYGLARSGDTQKARVMAAELERESRQRYVPPSQIAIIYVGLGEKTQALTWLERAYEVRDNWLTSITVDQAWRPLGSDPQFRELVRRVGLRLPD